MSRKAHRLAGAPPDTKSMSPPNRVSPLDPIAFGTAFAAITIASLAASLLPAWRATRTDPTRVLRD